MDNYLALLLFIVPGFVAYQIENILNDEKEILDNFKITLIALVYNIFIMFGCYIVFLNFESIDYGITFSELSDKFQSCTFFIHYITFSLLISIVMGITWYYLKKIYYWIMNYFRIKEGKNEFCYKATVLDECFNDGEDHLVKIIYDDKVIRGWIGCFCSKSKEFYINRADEFIESLEKTDVGIKYKGVYIDNQNHLVIQEYDLKEYENEKNK